MLHLRLIVPPDRCDEVIDHLETHPGVVHVVRDAGTSCKPAGTVVVCDVVREAGNGLIEWLQDRGVHRDGAITALAVDTVVSDAAEHAENVAPGDAGDALIWESLEGRVRTDAALTASYLIFMAAAATIAAIGIMIDSPILVIGAMVVGPDYGPLASICLGLVRRRGPLVRRGAATAAAGFAVAGGCALVASLLLRVTDIAPDSYDLSKRELTSFISRPDVMALVVAAIAGVVGMLALTEARGGALIGVLVSVTTLPALGNAGLAVAYGAWSDLGGSIAQLAINVTGLVIAGTATLVAQARATRSHT